MPNVCLRLCCRHTQTKSPSNIATFTRLKPYSGQYQVERSHQSATSHKLVTSLLAHQCFQTLTSDTIEESSMCLQLRLLDCCFIYNNVT